MPEAKGRTSSRRPVGLGRMGRRCRYLQIFVDICRYLSYRVVWPNPLRPQGLDEPHRVEAVERRPAEVDRLGETMVSLCPRRPDLDALARHFVVPYI